MSLLQKKVIEQKTENCFNLESRVKERIHSLRYIILVNSLIYYEANSNYMEDRVFDAMCKELVTLQTSYPDISEDVIFAKDFKNFDGTTGFDLPYKDEQIVNIALSLLTSSGGYRDAINVLKRVKTTSPMYREYFTKHPNVNSVEHIITSSDVVKEMERKEIWHGRKNSIIDAGKKCTKSTEWLDSSGKRVREIRFRRCVDREIHGRM